MDRSRTAVAAALGFWALSRVEYDPAFAAAAAAPRSAPALRGHGSAVGVGAATPKPAGMGMGAAAAAVLGVAGVAAAGRRARARVQVRADDCGLHPSGPVTAYMQALSDAAEKKDEAVSVTKDVMMIREKYDDEDFLQELQYVNNEPSTTDLEKAQETVKLLAPFESTVMEKFVIFLAKKKRTMALKPICKEYIASLYFTQSILPVIVRSAARLSDKQAEAIKEKMKEKTGCSAIKLVNEVDGSMLAGFVVEWGFTDPENLVAPTQGIDLSLKSFLVEKAIDSGVMVDL